MQANKSSLWWHLISTMAADSNSFQITVSHGKPSFHGGAWQGSSSQPPSAPLVLFCVNTIPLLSHSSRANNIRFSGNLLKSRGKSTPSTRYGCFPGEKWPEVQKFAVFLMFVGFFSKDENWCDSQNVRGLFWLYNK